MSGTTPPPSGAGSRRAPRPVTSFWHKVGRWAVGIAVVVSGVAGLARLADRVTLPGCEATRTADTLRSIFKDKAVEVTSIGEFKSVTDTYAEKTCQAHVDTPSEVADIDYRVYWDGWDVNVMITQVRSEPK